MSQKRSSVRAAATATTPAGGATEQADLRRLGVALATHVDDVLARVVRLSDEADAPLDGTVRESMERICVISTTALARWMAGGDPRAGLEVARKAWKVFGELAAHRAAPLNQVTKRCLHWRDGVEQVLTETAAELGMSRETVAQAHAMVRVTLDVTLVRVCEVFEKERARTDQELSERQDELAFMATHDQLTGLPNRTLLLDRATQMLSRARRRRAPAAALLINLDNFKHVNDAFGRAAGDELLQAIAARLDVVVRDTDALGRLGGDEFVVLAEDVAADEGRELIAERLHAAFAAPFKLSRHFDSEINLTASIGLATGERTTAEELLRRADVALHRAKWEGKNRHVLFESGMDDPLQISLELEMDLRRALERGEFFLVYQPTFDIRKMAPTGVETLLRWNHPVRGVVAPNDFIPLLEDTGLIVDVGRWVLEEACRQGAAWRRGGHTIGVAVNVSARQLDDDRFVDDVRAAIAHSALDASALTLEITETNLMRNADETARRLHAIKRLGVRIAIDDFGTGYSSLSHLQRFPVDALKIDRSFISQLTQNPEGETLIRTLVQLGKALSIETLAEGIEHESELGILREEDCDSGQGFLFARPLDVTAAEEFLRGWTAADAAAVLA
jgi:diguanylate cyclase (GGDEF)-like protein